MDNHRSEPMNNYSEKQKRRDTQYQVAWEIVTPAQRKAMAKMGITGPDMPDYHIAKPDDSARLKRLADVSTKHYTDEPVEQCDVEDKSACGNTSNPCKDGVGLAIDAKGYTDASDALAAFCSRIRSSPNPLMQFDAACYAAGISDVEGQTETQLAKKHKVTRAAFSKTVINWCDTFGLRPSSGMKSKRSRTVYKQSQLTRKRNV